VDNGGVSRRGAISQSQIEQQQQHTCFVVTPNVTTQSVHMKDAVTCSAAT